MFVLRSEVFLTQDYEELSSTRSTPKTFLEKKNNNILTHVEFQYPVVCM